MLLLFEEPYAAGIPDSLFTSQSTRFVQKCTLCDLSLVIILQLLEFVDRYHHHFIHLRLTQFGVWKFWHLTQGFFVTVDPVPDSFVFFRQIASQNRYALVTQFVTITVPSVVSSRLTIHAQVAQNISQMFLIQTVVLAFLKLHGPLQFLFSFVHLLQNVNQLGQTFLILLLLFGLRVPRWPLLWDVHICRDLSLCTTCSKTIVQTALESSTFLLEEMLSSTFDWISAFAQFAQHLFMSFQFPIGTCVHRNSIFQQIEDYLADRIDLISFQSFLGSEPRCSTGGSQCSGFCTCCKKRYDGRLGYDTSLRTFLGSFRCVCVVFSYTCWNDSLLGFSFFYCVVMKLHGEVPAVTFMGGWSDVRDGIVHGLHFYQKTIDLMFIHSCICITSEFDQCLFVGGVSEPTNVHLKRILFEVTLTFHQGC